MIGFLIGFILGIFVFVGYGAYRALNTEGWDDSNLLNWLRLLSHVYIHPKDFGEMYYIDDPDTLEDLKKRDLVSKPFDYISKDEFSENFPDSRP